MNSWEYLLWNRTKETGIYILSSEAEDWILMTFRGFKGLKQAIKLEFKLGRYSDVSWPLTCSLPFYPS